MDVAVVTGASRGIGRACALALADAGFEVALLARSQAGLDETRRLVEQRGGTASTLRVDVTDADAVEAAVQEVESAGAIGALVNNAGTMAAVGPLWEVDPDDWWLDVRTSLGGAFNLTREVVPRMIERGRGRVINVVSYAATRPAPYQTAYAAAKAALVSLTEALAAAVEEHGVRAFAVAPAFTDTEMTRHLATSEAAQRWLPGATDREAVDPERSAHLVALLAAGGADALNGRLLHALDDVEELLQDVDRIRRDDLYALRVRRLS